MNEIFKRNFKTIDKEAVDFVNRSFAIADQIFTILEKQGKTQRELAMALGKKESEVSKWLQGTHNFTLKTLAKIEQVLGEKIYYTANEVAELKELNDKTVYFSVSSRELVKSQLTNTSEFIAEVKAKEVATLEKDTVTIPADDPFYKQPA